MNKKEPEHIGVVIIIVDRETNKILLGKRINAYKSGFFGLPGGRIDLLETTGKAAKREVEEETGLQVEGLEYVGVVRELQDGYNFVHFGMTTTSFTGDLVNREPNKCEGWAWYSMDNLPDKILLGHKAMIDIFLGARPSMIDLGHE